MYVKHLWTLPAFQRVYKLQRPKIPVLDPLVAQVAAFSFPGKSVPHHLPPHPPFPVLLSPSVSPWNSQATKNDYLPVSPPYPNQPNEGAELT